MDKSDADISILLNFGASAYLQLTNYKCNVLLQPLDIVFLRANSVLHCTIPVNYPLKSSAPRWAVSCFMRKKIAEQAEPDNDKHLLEFIKE